MVTGGWKIRKGRYVKYFPLQEVSIMCSKEELEDIAMFLSSVLREAKTSGVHGQHQHYKFWKKRNESDCELRAESDIVIIVTE